MTELQTRANAVLQNCTLTHLHEQMKHRAMHVFSLRTLKRCKEKTATITPIVAESIINTAEDWWFEVLGIEVALQETTRSEATHAERNEELFYINELPADVEAELYYKEVISRK